MVWVLYCVIFGLLAIIFEQQIVSYKERKRLQNMLISRDAGEYRQVFIEKKETTYPRSAHKAAIQKRRDRGGGED